MILRHAAVMLLWWAGAAAALAQATDWPARPVTLVVPSSPGGGTDVYGRILAQALTEALKQSFVVDNKPGATQMIGARLAANAKPDGATIFFGSVTSLAINPSVKKELPYDPVRDF